MLTGCISVRQYHRLHQEDRRCCIVVNRFEDGEAYNTRKQLQGPLAHNLKWWVQLNHLRGRIGTNEIGKEQKYVLLFVYYAVHPFQNSILLSVTFCDTTIHALLFPHLFRQSGVWEGNSSHNDRCRGSRWTVLCEILWTSSGNRIVMYELSGCWEFCAAITMTDKIRIRLVEIRNWSRESHSGHEDEKVGSDNRQITAWNLRSLK